MSAREIIALGTSSQVPTRYRNHNGYLLRWDEHGLLFDPGEGTQRQMIYAEVTVTQVTQICITHFHGDHCLGLAGISQRISLDRVPHEIGVFFPRSGRKYYDRLRKASIYHDVSKIRPYPIEGPGPVWEHEDVTLSVRRLDHAVETFGYRLQERDGRTMLPDELAAAGVRGPAIKELIRQGELEVDGRTVKLEDVSVPKPGQSMAFVMDTRMCDGAFELAEGVDLLVCESTYLSSEEREARDHGHLTARQAATIAKEAGARRLVLTHFSQRYGSLKPFLAEARALHDDVVAVRDGDRVPVPKRRGHGKRKG
ncbi:MAG TPA: ribonuclease Z [Sandaracinaceae bacterium LLY-WYZ-13_1]|nr:ribonuclease Z [Sandaracinaceae bacterium LLY-WYZ-13_1]